MSSAEDETRERRADSWLSDRLQSPATLLETPPLKGVTGRRALSPAPPLAVVHSTALRGFFLKWPGAIRRRTV